MKGITFNEVGNFDQFLLVEIEYTISLYSHNSLHSHKCLVWQVFSTHLASQTIKKTLE